MRKLLTAAVLALVAIASAHAAPDRADSTRWAAFRDRFVERLFQLDPSFAVYQGRHDFDGRLPDWSEAGLKRQTAFLRDAIARAQAMPETDFSAQDRFERAYLIVVAQGRLFWLAEADQPHRNPAFYVGGGLDPNVYIARPYAPPAVRMKALTRMFRAVPAAAAQIRANLKTPMPASFIAFGAAGFDGFADFYANDAAQAFTGVKDAAAQREFAAAAKKASDAMRELAAWLKAQPASTTPDYALGAERFARMLAMTEDVALPLAQIEAAGRADLERNQAALKEACTAYAPGATIEACAEKANAHKADGGPVAAARRMIPELRQFVIDHDIVTIPGTEQALVEESPPYNRQNGAYIDPPGPFDKGIPSVYYLSPPDPSWPQEKQDAYVPGQSTLLATTVHEVMPGHFVQFLHANRSRSTFGRLFVGYAFAEGWAHYTEQMMWDAGFHAGDPETHIGQLTEALLRNCRLLSAIGLHTQGMTEAQSKTMFVEQCHQDEGTADQQAARGTYDPAYLNYTLGKLLITQLRDDWTATRGGRAAWKAFHDRFLGFGGPPIPLVRRMMMGEDASRPTP